MLFLTYFNNFIILQYLSCMCISASPRDTAFINCLIWNRLLDLIYGCLTFEKFMIGLLTSSIFLRGYRWGGRVSRRQKSRKGGGGGGAKNLLQINCQGRECHKNITEVSLNVTQSNSSLLSPSLRRQIMTSLPRLSGCKDSTF